MSKVKTNSEDELIYPNCKGNYLQQVTVDVVFRSEDKDGVLAVSSHSGTEASLVKASEALGRRDAIKIGFVCECCGAMPELSIIQHKGSTKFNWTNSLKVSFPLEAR